MQAANNLYSVLVVVMSFILVMPLLSEACHELTNRDRLFWKEIEKRHAKLLFPLNPVSTGRTSGAAHELTEKGIHAFMKGDFPAAQEHYSMALRDNSQEAALYHNLALIAFSRLELTKASELWRRAQSIEPGNMRYVFHVAFALASDGKAGEAINFYKKLLVMMNGRPEVYNSIGQLYEFKGEISSAASYFKKALGMNHDYLPALSNLAGLYKRNNRHSEAIRVYKKLIAKTPGDADNYVAIGDIYKEKGKYNLAAEYFKKALGIRADYPEIHILLAGLYKQMGRLREAEEEEKQAYAISCSLRPNNME